MMIILIIIIMLRGDCQLKFGCFFEKGPKGGGGSFSMQKNKLQILLVSKRYILVVNFGKNVQKGGEGGRSSPIQKISLQIYAS